MKTIRTLIFIGLFINAAPYAVCQDFPDLVDRILICNKGALPFYVSCEDTTCAEEFLYPNGTLKARGKCKDRKKVGMWTAYYENGNIMSEGIIKEELLYGDWVFYYENGNKKAEGEFRAGQFELGCAGSENFIAASIMNGKWIFWNEDGRVNIVCRFTPNNNQEEILNGKYTMSYTNGQKQEEGIYYKGMKNGIWTYRYANGQKQKEEYYKYKDCGIYDYIWYECPSGTWTYWKKDGTLLKTEIYEEGILQEERNY